MRRYNTIFELAVNCHRAGRLQQASRLYQQLLDQDPTHADATFRHIGGFADAISSWSLRESRHQFAIGLEHHDRCAACGGCHLSRS